MVFRLLIFYNEAYLAPLAEEIKKSEYIYITRHVRPKRDSGILWYMTAWMCWQPSCP